MAQNHFLAGVGRALLFDGNNLIGVVRQPCTFCEECVLWVKCWQSLKPISLNSSWKQQAEW